MLERQVVVSPTSRTCKLSLSFNRYVFFQRLIVSSSVVALVALLIDVLYLLVDGCSSGNAGSSVVASSNLLALVSRLADLSFLLLRQPVQVVSDHSHLNVRLTINTVAVSFANDVLFPARVYNGSFSGPTLVMHAWVPRPRQAGTGHSRPTRYGGTTPWPSTRTGSTSAQAGQQTTSSG
jgi:hypothetical protein